MLSESSLKSGIKSALEDGSKLDSEESGAPPMIHSKVAKGIAKAYDDYAKSAMAGGAMTPTLSGPSMLETPFAAPDFAGVGPALMLYWLAAVWAGPGFASGVTVPAAMAGAAPDIKAMIAGAKPDSADAFASKFAGILHKYTTMMTVLAIPIPPAAAVTLPIA